MRLFSDHLHEFGDRIAAIAADGTRLTYAALAAEADKFSGSLGGRRKLVVVETLNELAPLIAYLGALRGRHPVILAGDGTTIKDGRILKTFAPEAVFRRGARGWGLEELGAQAPALLHEDLAVLLSTSGSTGSPKLVRLSRANIATNAQTIAQYLGLSPSERAITALPFHYSYGMSIINSHLAVGATLLLTEASVTNPEFCQFFESEGATSLAGVPYTFDLLDRIRFQERDLLTLRTLTVAGGRLAPERIMGYARWGAKRGVRLFVMYGQTEAAPRMSYVPPELALEYPNSIGRPIPGGAFCLIDAAGCEIEMPEEVGELVYRGPNVMLGYALCKDDLARGRDIDELHTGDFACRNRAGLYRIVGRKARFSKLLGQRLSLDEIEGFLAEQGIAAAVAGDDQRIVIATTRDGAQRPIARELAERCGLSAAAILVVERDEIPRLPTGKVDYWSVLDAGIQQAADVSLDVSSNTSKRALRNSFSWALGKPEIGDTDTFNSLGGDSLSYVEVSLAIERQLGYLPDGWEEMSLAHLEGQSRRPRTWPSLQTDIVLRTLAIIGIIFSHASPNSWPLAGGADVLLILAGHSLARFHGTKLWAGQVGQVLVRYIIMLVLPYLAIVLAFGAFRDGGLTPSKLRWILTVDYEPHPVEYLWFLQVLFQSVVVFLLAFLVPAFRAWAKLRPWLSGCFILVMALALHFCSNHFSIPGLYNRYTIDKLFLVVLGWGLFFTSTRTQKWVIAGFVAIIVGFIYIHLPVTKDISRGVWVACTIAAMLCFARLPAPVWLHQPITMIASASFYIYLMQLIPMMQLGQAGAKHWWRIPDITVESLALGLAFWGAVRILNRAVGGRQLPTLSFRRINERKPWAGTRMFLNRSRTAGGAAQGRGRDRAVASADPTAYAPPFGASVRHGRNAHRRRKA
jgi:acyl-CoA synthetase (AMP-forming)/AMP-acid ligase II